MNFKFINWWMIDNLLIMLIVLEIPWITKCKMLDNYKFPVYTTSSCPMDQLEWGNRARHLNCSENNGYICMPNKKRTELLQFCYTKKPFPIEKGVCLVMDMIASKIDSYDCMYFENGCPNTDYWSNEIYKRALQIYKSLQMILKWIITILQQQRVPKKWNTIYTDENPTEACILLFVLTSLVFVASCIIMVLCIFRRKKIARTCFVSARKKICDGDEEKQEMLHKNTNVNNKLIANKPASSVSCPRLPVLTFSGIEVIGGKTLQKIQLKYRVSSSFHSTWKKDGKEISRSEKYTIEKNVEELSLTINTISKEDQGQYNCLISDGNASEEYPAVELRSPRIKEVLVCTQGKAVRLKCSIDVPKECKNITSISWLKDDLPLSGNDKFSCGGIEDPSLTIQNPNESDVGNWQVVVSNVFGDDNKRPAQVNELSLHTQGNAVKLKCSIDLPKECNGITSITWLKDNLPLSGNDKYFCGGIEDPSLTIQNPDESDVGNCQVVVSNAFGEDVRNLHIGCLRTPIKGIKVFLATGESSEIKVDAIITFSDQDLNMNHSTFYKALKEKFGKGMEQMIEKNYFRGLSPTQVADIPTEGNCCKRIYVGVLPEYTSENFQKIIVNCLHMSTGKGIESLCLPCFGNEYCFVKAVQNALEAIMEYDKILSGTAVKIIYIFVEKDLELYNKINCFLKSSPETRTPQDNEKAKHLTGTLQLGGEKKESKFYLWPNPQIKLGKEEYGEKEFITKDVSISLLQNDITDVEADALINSSNERLDLRWGRVSKIISKKCGQKLDDECSRKCEEMKRHKVVVTSGYTLKVKHIIHIDCPMTVFEWIERLQVALKKADDLKCNSLSLPLIGTESFIPFAVETMCEVILVSISKYKCSFSDTHLKQVKIVAFDPKIYNRILLFLDKAASTK